MAETAPPPAAPLAHLPVDHPAQAYGALPARELIRFVQVASADPNHPEAQVIFTAFYHRYFPYLVTVVSNALGFLHDHDGIQEIVHDALTAFFRNSQRFKTDLGDDAGCDQLVRSYLGRLAKWKASDARSFQQSIGADVVDEETLLRHVGASASTEHEVPPTQRDLSAVTAWIDSLREAERDVLRTYFLDDHLGQQSGRLPDGIASRLAEKHGVTTSNIRHMKSKLLAQMRERFSHLARKG